jgi:hypothetical protein
VLEAKGQSIATQDMAVGTRDLYFDLGAEGAAATRESSALHGVPSGWEVLENLDGVGV